MSKNATGEEFAEALGKRPIADLAPVAADCYAPALRSLDLTHYLLFCLHGCRYCLSVDDDPINQMILCHDVLYLITSCAVPLVIGSWKFNHHPSVRQHHI